MLKKRCPNCKRKIEREFEFCPWCGNLTKKKEDYGLLGERDDEDFFDEEMFPMNKIIEKVLFDMNKLFKKSFNENLNNDLPFGNIQIKFSSFPQKKDVQQNKNSFKQQKKINKGFLKNKLPIVKAEAKFKRLPEGIVYEISVPGVNSKEDIFINRVEEGIEIRAYTKDKCYIKTIPLKVDSYSYLVKDGKIFFQIKN